MGAIDGRGAGVSLVPMEEGPAILSFTGIKNCRRDAGATKPKALSKKLKCFFLFGIVHGNILCGWNTTKVPRGGAPGTRLAARHSLKGAEHAM